MTSAGARPADGPEILRDERGIPHIFATDDARPVRRLRVRPGPGPPVPARHPATQGTTARLAALLGTEGIELDRVAHTIDFPAWPRAAARAPWTPRRARCFEAFADGVETAARSMRRRRAAHRVRAAGSRLGALDRPTRSPGRGLLALAVHRPTARRRRARAPAAPPRRRATRRGRSSRASDEADTPDPAAGRPLPERQDSGPTAPRDAAASHVRRTRPAPTTGSSPGPAPARASRCSGPTRTCPTSWTSASTRSVSTAARSTRSEPASSACPDCMFGRNRDLAWGITNNICSLRDLYQERPCRWGEPGLRARRPSGARPGRSRWRIAVRDADAGRPTVVRTRNGPLVDDTAAAAGTRHRPGQHALAGHARPCDWTAALLRLDRARSVGAAIEACEGWLVPTFSLLLGDTAGDIGYLATGRIPLRDVAGARLSPGLGSGARTGRGLIPTAGMPRARDPERGWLATANNRPAPDDYPYPLFGTWDEGYRAAAHRASDRGRRTGVDARRHDARMHADVRSLRAEAILPDLLALFEPLADGSPGRVTPCRCCAAGTCESRADSAGAADLPGRSSFRWAQAVIAERVSDRATADYLANWGLGLGSRLLRGRPRLVRARSPRGGRSRRPARGRRTSWKRCSGPIPPRGAGEPSTGCVLRHPLSARGDLGELFDKGPPCRCRGDLATLEQQRLRGRRAGDRRALAGWRRAAPATDSRSTWARSRRPRGPSRASRQSALLGSPHYDDQREDYVGGSRPPAAARPGRGGARSATRRETLPDGLDGTERDDRAGRLETRRRRARSWPSRPPPSASGPTRGSPSAGRAAATTARTSCSCASRRAAGVDRLWRGERDAPLERRGRDDRPSTPSSACWRPAIIGQPLHPVTALGAAHGPGPGRQSVHEGRARVRALGRARPRRGTCGSWTCWAVRTGPRCPPRCRCPATATRLAGSIEAIARRSASGRTR